MKKNKKILILGSLIVVMVVALTFVVTRIGAWLTDTDQTEDVTLQVGQVVYNASGLDDFVDSENAPFVPGQNLVANNGLELVNASTVLSELRFSYTITYVKEDTTTGDALDENLFSTITWAAGWAAGTGGVNDPTGYFYLSVNGNQQIASTYTTAIKVIEELVLNGHTVGNDFANAVFTINFVFQAKQAEHLTWQDAGTFAVDFGTGLSATP